MRRSEQRRAAVVAIYQSDVTGRPAGELVESAATSLTRELVEGTLRHRADLAQRIGAEMDARSRSAGEAQGQERLL